jgi:hypothetical protein
MRYDDKNRRVQAVRAFSGRLFIYPLASKFRPPLADQWDFFSWLAKVGEEAEYMV